MSILTALTIYLTFSPFIYFQNLWQNIQSVFEKESQTVLETQDPNDYIFPKIEKSDSYTIFLVGDSMTAALGPFGDEIKKNLKKYYPHKEFNVQNYSLGSSNILTVEKRFNQMDNYQGHTFRPIFEERYDLIIVESFGNNPLSDFPLEEGLKKQNEALDKLVKTSLNKKPNAGIIFLATIAPLKNRYGEGIVNLLPEQRQKWVGERIAYIKNHIKYAKAHNIPLINAYEKSQKDGDGNIDYINTNDFIHPSPTGIQFLGQEIADYIYRNKLLPR